MENRFYHLVPLVLFTVLAIVGSGLMIGAGLLFFMGFDVGTYLLWVFILIGTGVMISFFHLGRKGRFLRAVVGVGHSWLSREVIVAGIFAVFAGGGYFLVSSGKGAGLLFLVIGIGVVSAVFLVLTIGMVYNLVTRLSWSGFFNWFAPFSAALLLGVSCFVLGS
ncbi:MAG: dimethyl sulfoxide reductase anchor subunit, partial [bacterium]|nr:dimethyl sulfoxide reductase anchor subunit [bacterium]